MNTTRNITLPTIVGLFAALAACKGGGAGKTPPTPPAYTTVLDEKPVMVSPTRQQVTLQSPVSGQGVVLKIPANAVAEGVPVSVRLVSGIAKGPGTPVGDLAVEILPRGLTFATPVRARVRVPAPPVNKRYSAVQSTEVENAKFVQRFPGRRVGLGTAALPDSEEWEIDLEGSGVWGVGENAVDLGEVLASGAVVTDEVEIPALDEEQMLFVGPPAQRRLLVVSAAQTPAAGPPSPAGRGSQRPFAGFRAAETSAPPRLLAQTAMRQRSSVVVQTVSPLPMRGRTPPLSQTAMRVRSEPLPQEVGMIAPPRVRVVQPLPILPPMRARTPVNAPEDAGPWDPSGTARRSPTPVMMMGGIVPAADTEMVEYDLPENPSGYWGLAEFDSPAPPEATLAASPPAINFPASTVGESRASMVTLVNNGGSIAAPLALSLSGPQAGSFSLDGGCAGVSLAPAGTCTVTVTFAPATSGSHAAALVISGGATVVTVNLSGVASLPAGLTLTPLNIDFGSVVTGGMSAVSDVTIGNPGGQPAGIPQGVIGGAQPGDFQIVSTTCNAMIAAGGSCVMRLQFVPTNRGARTASLAVSATPGGTGQVNLTGAGQQLGDLQITPSTFSFGNLALGAASVAQVFTVSNPSDITSGVPSVGKGGANPAAFTITGNGCTGALAPAASCAITVVFQPTLSGAALATLQVSASPGGSVGSALSGNGQANPLIAAAPGALDLGGVVRGQQGTPSSITLSNGGDLPTGNLSIALAGAAAGDFSLATDSCTGVMVPGGGTCAVTVQFSPSALGARTASLTFSAAPGGDRTVTLQGTGLAQASLSFSPSSANLGGVVLGQSSTATRFTLTNGGAQASSVPALALVGANPADFQLAGNTCGSSLPGFGTCTVDVLFAPTGAGARAASLQATASPGGVATVGLGGNGLRPAALSANPPSADLGAVVAVTGNSSVTVTVTNDGDVPSGAITPSIAGVNAADFSIVGNSCTAALAGGDSCAVQIRFAPAATGSRSATLTVSATPGGPVAVALTGTGLGTAAMTGSTGTLTFGAILVGASSGASLVTLTNDGTATTGTIMRAVSGANPGDFASTSACATLAPGQSCTVSVTFTPGASGFRSGILSLQANPGGTVVVNLSGDGFTPAALSVSAASYDFGGVLQGKSSTAQVFTVSNTGGAPSGVPNVALGGANPALFTVTSNGCTAAIPAGMSCAIGVAFTPAAVAPPGSAAASLSVTATPGGADSSDLAGTVMEDAIFVATVGSAVNPGSRTQPLHSVQAGVDAAAAAGISKVLVATGTYTPGNGGLSVSAISGLHVTAPVQILGAWDSTFTTLTANSNLDVQGGASHVVWIASSNVILRDFTIQGGSGAGADPVHHYGGGVYVYNDAAQMQNIMLERLIVQNCAALQDGGGIRVDGHETVTIADSTISNNTASNGVGGIAMSGGRYHTVRNTYLTGNTGFHGALTVFSGSDATVEAVQTSANNSMGGAGGIMLWGGFNVTVKDCDINEATIGLFLNANAGAQITNLTIDNNAFRNSQGGGSAVAIYEGQTPLDPQNLTRNRFDLTGLTNLYRNGSPGGELTPAGLPGIDVLNTPNHPDHTAVNASGNMPY